MIKRIRNLILYAAIQLLCAFLFVLLHSYFFLLTMAFFGLLLLYDVITLKILKSNVKISICNMKDIITKQSLVKLPLSVNNPTILFSANLYIRLEINNEFYEETAEYTWNVPLYAKESEMLQIPMKFLASGRMKIVLKEIRIRGILGVLETKQKSALENIFYVYPKSLGQNIKAREYEGLQENEKTKRQEGAKQGNNFSEVSGIREYIPGDSIRNIHWKLSAKKEKLMVKEHVAMSDTRQILLVELADVRIGQQRCVEQVLELLMNFMQEFMMQEISFEMVWWNHRQKTLEHLSVGRIEHILRAVERILDAGMYQNNFWAEQVWRQENPRGENYLWLGIDEEALEETVVIKGSGCTVVRWGN